MAEAWYNRLNEALRDKGWTAADLAREIGEDYSRIKKWTEGKRRQPPDGELLARVAAALDVNDLWLSVGVQQKTRGRSFLERIPKIHLSELSALRSKNDLPKLLTGRPELPIPAVAGPRAVVVELDDDSMADSFQKGTLIVCDPDQPAVPGRYVVAVVRPSSGPRAVFRRFQELAPGDQGVGVLHAENEHYAPIHLRSDKDGFIIGRAVGLYAHI